MPVFSSPLLLLDVAGNPLGSQGLDVLAETVQAAYPCRLRSLDISHTNPFVHQSKQYSLSVRKLLQGLPDLTQLKVAKNHLDSEDSSLNIIFQLRSNMTLLDLSENRLSDQFIDLCSQSQYQKPLTISKMILSEN